MVLYFDNVREEIKKLANPENLRPLEECKETLELLRREKRNGNPYIELAEDFRDFSKGNFSDYKKEENKYFYLYLSSLEDKNSYSFLLKDGSFIEVKVDLLNPFVEVDGEECIDPRWHFLVSWHAFLDAAWNHPEDKNASKITSIKSKPGKSVLNLPGKTLKKYYEEAPKD